MSTAFTQAPSNDFSSVYKPANAVEQMMVDQIGMMWQRLQFAASAEQRYFATRDILEILEKKPQEYKAITRLVSDCERAWRHAIVHLETISPAISGPQWGLVPFGDLPTLDRLIGQSIFDN